MKKSLFIIPLLFISLSFNFINTYSTKEINKNIQNNIYTPNSVPSKWWYN